MSYSAVITHVQADPEAGPRLACAVEVARRFDAALIGVAAEMIQPLAYDTGYYSVEAEWIAAMREAIENRIAKARTLFGDATAELADKAAFLSGLQLPAQAIALASRAADLIVAGGAPSSMRDRYTVCDTAELAIISGRPVLVAPPIAAPLSAKRVLLAWKDTREARRALSDAMPFLERAERVVVVAVGPGNVAEAAHRQIADVAVALRRRKINVEAKVVEQAHDVGGQLLKQASLEGADLIVSGAYGHSRLGEWAFGGVTADLLSQDQVYLLLSH
ncbi:MAG TPA: universal stress protein [Caulobacteraceae bacterium]|jgi:nucleotide-binding universal stress UspA family protein|nr:universal stress protein [Caulobacteraceae bacterium]